MMEYDTSLELSEASILIVDDTHANLRLLSGILIEQGYNVRPATNGDHALTAARAEVPDLILLDIKMPEMSGYEVCERLKGDERTRDVPVVFISALSETFDKIKAFSLGAVDYITKPFQYEEVLARVKTHLTIRRQQQKIQQQNSILEAKNKAVRELNTQLQQEIFERRRAEKALEDANRELQRLASLDGLTQLANRRRFDGYLQQEWLRMAREQLPLSIILCDIDHFKHYNDSYGHQAGDECLRQVARCMLGASRRPTDLVARYGGEEFIIILSNTEAEGAMHVAQRLQREIETLQIPHNQSPVKPYVTLSMGVSNSIPVPELSSEQLIEAADKALYEVKNQGRNGIRFQTLSPMSP